MGLQRKSSVTGSSVKGQQDTNASKAMQETKVSYSPYARKQAPSGSNREDLARKSLREYLQASPFYTDKEGNKRWKEWQPKGQIEEMHSLYRGNCNLPLRFNLGLMMTFLPSLVLLACLMFLGSIFMSLLITAIIFAGACVSLPFLIKRWDDSLLRSRLQEENASNMIGLGAMLGLFLGMLTVILGMLFLA